MQTPNLRRSLGARAASLRRSMWRKFNSSTGQDQFMIMMLAQKPIEQIQSLGTTFGKGGETEQIQKTKNLENVREARQGLYASKQIMWGNYNTELAKSIENNEKKKYEDYMKKREEISTTNKESSESLLQMQQLFLSGL